jgi:hypothetical protein
MCAVSGVVAKHDVMLCKLVPAGKGAELKLLLTTSAEQQIWSLLTEETRWNCV